MSDGSAFTPTPGAILPRITGRTRLVGVMGHPVAHSLSPAMHNAAFRALGLDFCYVPFDVMPEAVPDALRGARALGLVGLNVTIPHKPAVYKEMDLLAPGARAVEAVNTVEVREGLLVGHNTDGEGFARSLEAAGVPVAGQRVTLIGAGGAARSVAAACVQRGAASVVVLSRRLEQAEDLSKRLLEHSSALRAERDSAQGDSSKAKSVEGDISGGEQSRIGSATTVLADVIERGEAHVTAADILVQCTPLGMYPHQDDPLPLPERWIRPAMVVVDLIYNPEETRLLSAAKAAGARAINGVEMLVCQGAVAFEIWTGTFPPLDVMRGALLDGLRQRP